MQQLVKVKVEFDFVMVTNDDYISEAQDILKAQDFVSDALADMNKRDIFIKILPYRKGSVNDWDEDLIPYGGDGETVTRDYPIN